MLSNMSMDVVKHCSLWVVFSYFYLSGLNMALTLSIDGQQDPDIRYTLLHIFVFNLLVGHLINKYEKRWPFLASIIISCFAIIGFGHYVSDTLILYSDELVIGLLLLLPLATFSVQKIRIYVDEKAAS
ncbi:hypothetical protein ACSLBF_09745 [Pseudoalteromonas sp. T1lg65]|uniref:hypothetical protein n=1 Tax=Pseudoalteromonas sp. T1lg65 TaxID=2077101 RepID=UPI003F79EC55